MSALHCNAPVLLDIHICFPEDPGPGETSPFVNEADEFRHSLSLFFFFFLTVLNQIIDLKKFIITQSLCSCAVRNRIYLYEMHPKMAYPLEHQ